MSRVTVKAFGKAPAGIATGQCLCGKVQVEISIPAFWAALARGLCRWL
jgi:hypothetical protein